MRMSRILVAALLVAVTVLLTACNSDMSDTSATERLSADIHIGECSGGAKTVCGKEIKFVGESEKQKWIEPLERLLSNVLIPYGERGEILGYNPTLDDDLPAIPQNHSCALFDITEDGVPELLVVPFGGFGSSGAFSFEAFDIYTGEYLGYICCGNAYSWSVYYRSDTEETDIIGRYWLRMGWAGRVRYITKIEYDACEAEYREINYLTSEHEISVELLEREDPYVGCEFVGDEYVELYPNTIYGIYDEEVYIDDYFDEYDRFTNNFTRIPETELIILGWGEVAGDLDEEDYVGRAARMARALVSTEQEFVIYEY